MRNTLAFVVLLLPRLALAGGFEIAEQSPVGVATVGAQTATAGDPSAVYYNPAGLAYQVGLGALVGGSLAAVNPEFTAGAQTVNPNSVQVGPTVYVAQRLGRHFAVGIGAFSNFAEHFDYPRDWVGRYAGQFVDLTTYTFNPVVAYRPIERLSVAVGLTITPSTVQLKDAINFGGADGQLQYGGKAVGVGANAGAIIDVVPRYLRFGFSYRSRQDLNFSGNASVIAPPEVAAMVPMPTRGSTTIVLPHNMTFALATQPTDHLLLEADFRVTLWSDLGALTLNLQDSAGNTMMQRSVALDLRDSYGARLGGEYRFLDGRVPLRLGVGYDNTPVPTATSGPILPDTDRVLVGGGLGYRGSWWSLEVSYLAAILLRQPSSNPALSATYSDVGHVISAALIGHFDRVGGRLSGSSSTAPSRYAATSLRSNTW